MKQRGAVAKQNMVELQFFLHDRDRTRCINSVFPYDTACIRLSCFTLNQNTVVDAITMRIGGDFACQFLITAYRGIITQKRFNTSAFAAGMTDFLGSAFNLSVLEIVKITIQIITKLTIRYNIGVIVSENENSNVAFEKKAFAETQENSCKPIQNLYVNTVKTM